MTAFAPDTPKDPQAEGPGPVATSLPHPVKPKLRGWLHLGMFPAALVAGWPSPRSPTPLGAASPAACTPSPPACSSA